MTYFEKIIKHLFSETCYLAWTNENMPPDLRHASCSTITSNHHTCI